MSPKRGDVVGTTAKTAEGFRRLNLYRNAIDPCDLRALLDRRFPADNQRDVKARLGRKRAEEFKDGIQVLDEISSRLFQKQAGSRSSCPVVNFILATDKTQKIDRARAIVARAYWRADEYAHAFAHLLDDAKNAETHALAIEKALDALRIPIAESIRINEAWRYEHSSEKSGRRQDIVGGVSALGELKDQLQAFSQLHPRQGRPSDDARFFFVLRLSEAFSIWTGHSPDFHGADKRHGLWSEFVQAALDLTGLNRNGGLDYIFRRLGGGGPRAKAFLVREEFLDLKFEIAEWINKNGPHSNDTESISGIDKFSDDDVENWIDVIFDSEYEDLSDEPYFSIGKNLVLEALSALHKSKENLQKLWTESHAGISAGEAGLRVKLRNLPERFYNRQLTDFCEGNLPSAGFLIDLYGGQCDATTIGFEPPGYKWFLPASRNRRPCNG
ncbi:hypothetical protein [Methylocystis parvus]|uniref:Uncharacterized protein n=1 Tax=Methylocystis parvus TaxID=134 RepID=A0A6B8M925_9HYPH|nr:hypothetical protein [Methylocystis parvus]QGM97803.1 hypothetical protein F7D14_10205 [Methylocystis parvus]WBK01889.1 hypothetical protein MMG94_09375 [Methylocystis parvus OBBP]